MNIMQKNKQRKLNITPNSPNTRRLLGRTTKHFYKFITKAKEHT